MGNDAARPIKADTIVDGTNADSDGFYGLRSASFGFVFNGATFDSARALVSSTDAQSATQIGLTGVVNRNYIYNATGNVWDRVQSQANNADAIAVSTLGVQKQAAFTYAFNGTTFDRLRLGSAVNLSAATQPQALMITRPGDWSINHTPAANTKATISRAAGAAGVRHICTSISASLTSLAAAVSGVVQVNVRDGATGAGTILWSCTMTVGGATTISADRAEFALSGLNIVGTAATAMTIEFSAAGGVNTSESVAMTGYDVI